MIQPNPATGVAFTNPLRRKSVWREFRYGKSFKVLETEQISPLCEPFLPPACFRGYPGQLWGHFQVLFSCWRRWAVTGHSTFICRGMLSNSRDNRGDNAVELTAPHSHQENLASRIYFPKFRRAHFLWKDKIMGNFSAAA